MDGTRVRRFLAAYDEHLRTDAEIPNAVKVDRHGPLYLATFMHGRGFVTYQELGVVDAEDTERLVEDVVAHYEANPQVDRVEWKTRGHDYAPGLHEALVKHGFEEGEQETVMIGEARLLSVDVIPPEGVTLRRITEASDVRAMSAMQDEVFGGSVSNENADALLHRIASEEELELWVAEADGVIVSAGRLEPVAGTIFAGIWGGATREEWRGRGIYRALTARRAQSALTRGRTLVNSDSTEYSRPILERSGLVEVSTTTPYHWRREG